MTPTTATPVAVTAETTEKTTKFFVQHECGAGDTPAPHSSLTHSVAHAANSLDAISAKFVAQVAHVHVDNV
jgi:hypothetical protein